MRSFTAHVRPGRAPVLVAEGFSWWALLLPLPWLLGNRLWLVSMIWIALAIGAGVLAALVPPAGIAAAVALSLGTGVFARDLRRFSLGLSGWRQAAVVVAPDHDAALARLLTLDPAILAESYGGPR